MTLKDIVENYKLVMKLPVRPNMLKRCNAYIDQALMNFNYETMTKNNQAEAIDYISDMIDKFNRIRGR